MPTTATAIYGINRRAEEILLAAGLLGPHRQFMETPGAEAGECGCELRTGGKGLCEAGRWEEGFKPSMEVIEEMAADHPPVPRIAAFEVQDWDGEYNFFTTSEAEAWKRYEEMKTDGYENLRIRINQNAEDDPEGEGDLIEDELLASWTCDHGRYKDTDPENASYPAESF